MNKKGEPEGRNGWMYIGVLNGNPIYLHRVHGYAKEIYHEGLDGMSNEEITRFKEIRKDKRGVQNE